MSTEKLPPFYVGQRVVAITNGEQYKIKKGQEFTILSVTQATCGCWVVDVGLHPAFQAEYFQSADCDKRSVLKFTGIGWMYAKNFAPLTSTFQAITFTEILETELTSAN